MKQFLTILSFLFLISCNEKDFSDDQSGSSVNKLKSGSTENLNDWTGIPVYIYPVRGLTSDRKYLSCSTDGKVVDLWNQDDLSGRQRWILNKIDNDNYNITIYSGVSSTRRFLSTNNDGTVVDLWTLDDSSGKQRWKLLDLGNDLFNIQIQGGVTNSRKYLSCKPEGTKVDLWNIDDLTGRQQWKIESAGEYELVSLIYTLESSDIISSLPDFLADVIVENNSPASGAVVVNFTQKASTSSTFRQTHGLTLKLGASVGVSVPTIINSQISTEITSSDTWEYGKTESREDSESYTFTLNMTPYMHVRAEASVTMKKLTANYTATLKSKINNVTKVVTGKWEGVQSTSVTYRIIDLSTETLLRTVSKTQGIPLFVDLTK